MSTNSYIDFNFENVEETLSYEAETILKQILEKQLSTSLEKAETVEFIKSKQRLHGLNHQLSGIRSLEDYLHHEEALSKDDNENFLGDEIINNGMSKKQIKASPEEKCANKSLKRNYSFSPHPDHIIRSRLDVANREEEKLKNEREKESLINSASIKNKHLEEIESTLWRGKESVHGISHLILDNDSSSRKSFSSKVEEILNSMDDSPLNKVRRMHENEGRNVHEIFSSPAPEILTMENFLKMKNSQLENNEKKEKKKKEKFIILGNKKTSDSQQIEISGGKQQKNEQIKFSGNRKISESQQNENLNQQKDKEVEFSGNRKISESQQNENSEQQKNELNLIFESKIFPEICPISEEEITLSKLKMEEITKMDNGKFSNYKIGSPSNILYIKNLHPSVKEIDLVSLFLKFQASPLSPLLFRLMKKGRMRNQAFVTFPDNRTAEAALVSRNGCLFQGKHLIISFARGSNKNS